jgi:hypothetical protein
MRVERRVGALRDTKVGGRGDGPVARGKGRAVLGEEVGRDRVRRPGERVDLDRARPLGVAPEDVVATAARVPAVTGRALAEIDTTTLEKRQAEKVSDWHDLCFERSLGRRTEFMLAAASQMVVSVVPV